MRSCPTWLVFFVALAVGIFLSILYHRRTSHLVPCQKTAAPPKPLSTASGIWGIVSMMPLQKLDTVQNMVHWRSEMSNLDSIIQSLGELPPPPPPPPALNIGQTRTGDREGRGNAGPWH